VHGFAGNVFPMIRARTLLTTSKQEELISRIMKTTLRTARVDEQYANWTPAAGGIRWLVQHCHGAPGMITCLADLPVGANPNFDQLLEKGGELTWRAGPLTKGPNLCHGTAGNGYAFLKLYSRTGERKWLDRARAFAMHAIHQSERHAQEYGQRRYSLWTGDLGLSVYLWDCIQGIPKFPTMDVF